MTKTIDEVKKQRKEIYDIASKYCVSNIRIFGSVLKGEEKEDSDIDLLVDIDYQSYGSGFARVNFKNEIESLLHEKIDVVTENSLHHLIKDQVIQESLPL